MNKFTDEFIEVDHKPSKAFHAVVGKYLIRLWAGRTACSTPKEDLPSISDYTHFEVAIFIEKDNCRYPLDYNGNSYDCFNIEDLNLEWENNSYLTHGHNQSVSFIRSLMKQLYLSQSITEKPCRQCKRANDIGVPTCWWCGSINPVS